MGRAGRGGSRLSLVSAALAISSFVVLAGISEARAQLAGPCDVASVGCHVDEAATFEYRNAAFDDIDLDTGWVPRSGPIQLRFQLSFGGSTEVDLTSDIVTEWPPALAVSLPGTPGTGRLAMNYGLELAVTLRFDVDVAGIRYRWEGAIPVPGIPEDLRAFAEGTFDPFLLPPSERPFSVRDVTDRVEVLRYDALGGLISIPGVGGGIVLTVQGDLRTSYQTLQIIVSDAPSPITMEGAFTAVGPDLGFFDYGASKDLLTHPEGNLMFDADIVLAPVLYLSFVGTRIDSPIAEVPIGIANEQEAVIFDDHATHVPLPDLRIGVTELSFGEIPVGGMSERTFTVANDGEAPLEVTLRSPMAPFAGDLATLTLPPGTDAPMTVSFNPDLAGAANAVLIIDTNDPDESMLVLRLDGTGLGAPDTGPPSYDAGPDGGGDAGPVVMVEEGGCGCRIAAPGGGGPQGPGAGPWSLGLLMALGAVARARRRR